MERITGVRALPGFRVHLRFTDGSEGVVDLSDLVGHGVFASWSTPGEFEKVFVDPATRTIAWPGGIDLDPDVLYAKATGRALPDTDAA